MSHPHAGFRAGDVLLGPRELRCWGGWGRLHCQAPDVSCCRLFYSETGLVTCDGLDFYKLTYFPDDLFMKSVARSSLEVL